MNLNTDTLHFRNLTQACEKETLEYGYVVEPNRIFKQVDFLVPSYSWKKETQKLITECSQEKQSSSKTKFLVNKPCARKKSQTIT